MSETRSRLWAFVGLCVAVTVGACIGKVDGSIHSRGVPKGSGGSAGTAAMGTILDGSCKDTQSDPAHCGSCSIACASGQVCAAGVCQAASTSCAPGMTLCSGVCADLTSTGHCGSCTNACASGQTCNAGTCQCPGSQMACNGACTDTQSNNNDCGGCNQPCAVGQVCTAGVCACAQGQTTCSGVCVDVNQSDANCGGCGKACGMGQSCSGGVCVSASGADGCSGSALGVTLKQIAVYQTTKIAVMDSGSEVATAQRKADVVSGRQTLFRLFVTVDDGFASRQLSARVTLTNAGTAAQYYGKQTISKSSVESDSSSTFQVYVPPEAVTADTQYHAELVECATGSGQQGAVRFPASGEIDLGARHTGGLKVKVLPIMANGHLPDTSDATLDVYRQTLMAMYPIDSITITVGDQLSTNAPVDWDSTLDALRAKRKSDNPPADVYYFGLLKPEDSFRTFCGNSCTTGDGYVADLTSVSYRAAIGIGFGDRVSAETMAHELGHNHGRNHSPCVQGGTISGVDGNYPYQGGVIGSWGYDARTKGLLDPQKNTDLMGYCSNVWLSDYTYAGITDRVAAVNGNASVFTDASALATFRVLLLGSKGPRWGVPITQPSLPEGQPIIARILDGAGNFVTDVEVYRTELSAGGSTIQVPEPKAGWASIQLPGVAAVPF